MKMATEFGTGKTIFILAIVVGCFAILWPKIFYPMIQSSVSPKPSTIPTTDCCDVIFEKDLNAIKIMSQLCEKILSGPSNLDKRFLLAFQQGRLTKDIVDKCNSEVHEKCNVDIAEFLNDKVRLGRTYQQMLHELRSLNSSLCLKINFGVSPALIGAPRRFRVWETKHLRQERPPHLRPHMLHPALREKGRAIPHSHIVPRVVEKETPAIPMPVPGMRPPMGGPGHVVPPPKTGGTMGIIMPLYTIGIVIFFMYTMMRLIFKKSDESSAYKEFQPDPEFRRVVFNDSPPSTVYQTHVDDSNTKLVVSAISGLVAEVNRDILSKQASTERTEEVEEKLEVKEKVDEVKEKPQAKPEKVEEVDVEVKSEKELEVEVKSEKEVEVEDKIEKEIERGVQVVGMEMTESLEGGQKWSRPPTPLTPRSSTPTIPPPPPPQPQSIYLEGSLPSQSQLLVSQSETEQLAQENDESPVILAGKVTLSLIGLDDTLKTDNGGPEITLLSDEEEEEEEEEDEGIEQVSEEDEAEAVDNIGFNGDEDVTTNYTTASAAGGLGDETAADISTMEPQHDEDQESEEELEEDEEEEEIISKPQVSTVAASESARKVEVEEDEEEEEDDEEDEEEEEEEEVGRPQSLLHQHQR